MYCLMPILTAIITAEIESVKATTVFVRLMALSPAHSKFSRLSVELINIHHPNHVKYQLHSNLSQLPEWQSEGPYIFPNKTILVKIFKTKKLSLKYLEIILRAHRKFFKKPHTHIEINILNLCETMEICGT